MDLLQNALSRKCAACCDLILNFSNGVHTDQENFLLDDEIIDPIVECMFPQLIDLVTPKNWTLFEAEHVLLLAMRLHQIEVVRLILEKWSDLINSTTIYGQSILVHALMCKSFDTVRLLMELPEFKNGNTYEDTVLSVSCFTKGCPIDIISAILDLLQKKKGFLPKTSLQEPLFYAAKMRRIDVVKLILSKDVTLLNESLDSREWTLLHCILAHEMNREEMLNYLFDEFSNQINVSTYTSEGNSILYFSIMHETPIIWIRKILYLNPELAHLKNRTSETPLMAATKMNNFEVVKFLVMEFNVDVNVQDAEGKTALEDAAWNDCVDIVRWLLEYGGANALLMNKRGYNIFNELFQCLRYGINDYEARLEVTSILMEHTFNETNFKETFGEIFKKFHHTILCIPRFELLQSWIYTCYINKFNAYNDIVRRFVEEFDLEGYPARNVIVMCMHDLVSTVEMERSVHIRVAEELGRCAEDAIYERKDLDLVIEVGKILKKENAVSCGISMRQTLFFPNPRVDLTVEYLREKLIQFYIAFNRLGFIDLDKTAKFCISEILFGKQQTFENKIFQLQSGVLQAQMKLMIEEPTPATTSTIELDRYFMTKQDLIESREFKMVKTYLSPKYINMINGGKEFQPLGTLCRASFRKGLINACKNRHSDVLDAKHEFYKIMDSLDIPLKLKNFLTYQYTDFY